MIIDIHTHQQCRDYPQLRSYDLRQVAELEPFCSVGIYPFDIPHRDMVEELSRLAACDFVAAIGETGIDRRDAYRESVEIQKKLFGAHVEIANSVSKPLIIHQVRAVEDTLTVLKGANVPVVFHGFTGSAESAVRIVERGYYLSFGQALLTNERLQSVFRQVPLHNIFLETDAAAIDLQDVYTKAAEIKQIEAHLLEHVIETNFHDTGLAATYRAIAGRR